MDGQEPRCCDLRMLLAAIALWFGVHWAFVGLMYAKTLKLTLYWKVMLAPLAVIGFALDVAFNVVFGTLMFRELPHELLFTDRVKRHFADGDRLAAWWARNLNLVDPGHI